MSQINVDNIKNRLGSGAPSFPNGIDVSSGVTTFTNGLNVGTGASVFSPGTNELALGTNSAERVRIDSSGNVGIGTNSADNLLTIVGDHQGFVDDSAQPQATLLIKHGTTGTNRRWIGIGASTTGAWIQSSSPGGSGLAAPLSINPGGGNIGIGTDNPGAKLHVSGGNIKVDSGYGIDFSANGNAAGMTSELLDDYEEGTWTPAFNRAGTTRTHSLQSGFYTKVGNKVSVTFEVELSAFSQGGSGQYSIQGLPFTSDNRGNYGGSLDVWGGVTLSSGYTKLGVMANGSSTIFILMQSSNNGGAPDTSGVTYATSNVILRGQFNYWSGS